MVTIVIVGAGNIGSRHLQGLQTLELPAEVAVVDPAVDSLTLTRERWQSTGCARHDVAYHTDLADLAIENANVAVIATTASVRAAVTHQLLEQVSVDAIVFEKVLFPSIAEYAAIADLLAVHAVDAWVNCARRLYPAYLDIRGEVGDDPLDIAVSGAGWNMASNAIHFLDLFAYLTGSDNLQIDTGGLRASTHESKHAGYREVAGHMTAEDARGNRCRLRCFDNGGAGVTVTIATPDGSWVIEESVGHLITTGGDAEPTVERVSIPLQSELTGGVIDSILRTGTTQLTPYGESRIHHEALIRALCGFFAEFRGKPVTECPIT